MRGALRKEVRLSYIRPTVSCIVLRTVIFASHSYIACGSLTGEYNITKAGGLLYHFPKGKYHSGQSPEYHFCP